MVTSTTSYLPWYLEHHGLFHDKVNYMGTGVGEDTGNGNVSCQPEWVEQDR